MESFLSKPIDGQAAFQKCLLVKIYSLKVGLEPESKLMYNFGCFFTKTKQ